MTQPNNSVAGRDTLGAPIIVGQDCYIKTYVWHGLRRYSAILNGYACGPARTTMLVAVADAHHKGGKPDRVRNADTNESVPLDAWTEHSVYPAPGSDATTTDGRFVSGPGYGGERT